MIRKILSFVVIQFFLVVTNSFGQSADFNKAANIYLSNLEKSGSAALYTECKTQAGKAVLVFSLNGKQGMLFEFRDDKVINSASLLLKPQNISIDIADTQGGIYTYTVMENHVKDLLKLPFKFVMPDNIKGIVTSVPNNVCVDKPPTP